MFAIILIKCKHRAVLVADQNILPRMSTEIYSSNLHDNLQPQ